MTSVQDLEGRVRDYLNGRIEVSALEEWLAVLAGEAAQDEGALRRLHNSLWLKIGEFGEGLLLEDQFVAELEALLSSNQVLTWQGLAVGSVGRASTLVAPRQLEAIGAVTTLVESPWADHARS